MSIKSNIPDKNIGAIIDFCLDASEQSNQDIIADLNADGINTDVIIPKLMNKINKQLYNKSWQEVALEKKRDFIAAAQKTREKVSGIGRDEMLAILKQLTHSGAIQMQHRDFTELTDNDLQSVLEEIYSLEEINDSKNDS